MAGIVQLTDANFDQSVKEGKVLVDFWAPWCGPCKMMAPVLEELAKENNEITIAKLNVDENPQVAAKYGIMSIPTLALLENGQEKDRIIGFTDKQGIKNKLKMA